MKVNIDDEWCPVYYLTDKWYGFAVEVEDAKVADWTRVFAEFDRVQAEMKAAVKFRKSPGRCGQAE